MWDKRYQSCEHVYVCYICIHTYICTHGYKKLALIWNMCTNMTNPINCTCCQINESSTMSYVDDGACFSWIFKWWTIMQWIVHLILFIKKLLPRMQDLPPFFFNKKSTCAKSCIKNMNYVTAAIVMFKWMYVLASTLHQIRICLT